MPEMDLGFLPHSTAIEDNLNFCVREEYLTPFVVLVPGFIFQLIKTYIVIGIGLGYALGNLKDRSAYKKTRCASFKTFLAWLLTLYEICSIGGTVYWDVIDVMDSTLVSYASNDTPAFDWYWLNYQCTSRVFVDSQNGQTVLAFVAVYALTLGLDEWLEKHCCCCCIPKKKEAEEAEEKEEKGLSCGQICIALFKMDVKEILILICNILLVIVYVPFILTHFLSGMLVFIPMVIASGIIGLVCGIFFTPITAVIFCWMIANSSAVEEAIETRLRANIAQQRGISIDPQIEEPRAKDIPIYHTDVLGQTHEVASVADEYRKTGQLRDISTCDVCRMGVFGCSSCLSSISTSMAVGCFIFMAASLLVAGQCMIPFYGGNDYLSSFWYTVNHRKWNVYRDNVCPDLLHFRCFSSVEDYERMWRFMVALF